MLIAPEAVLFGGWLVLVAVGLVGFGVAARWRWVGGRQDSGQRHP